MTAAVCSGLAWSPSLARSFERMEAITLCEHAAVQIVVRRPGFAVAPGPEDASIYLLAKRLGGD